ncbi:NUDIX domain-containing protein [Caulobacter sp. KR2-114]|uniref:NUDIX domain-containing protein n=1 Tax=Caulobacter sp. KR2-114 TaxID=3400912 RepID=UPI003C0AA9A3
MRERHTARVILLDADDRILLMKGRLPSDPGAPGAWFTVGGGLEAGESVLEAAAREIAEETGFTDAVLGPVVWYGEGIVYDRKRRPLVLKASYVVARCAGGEPSRAGWQPLESELVDDIRWWTLADLRACADDIYPDTLLELLPDVMAGRYPAEPLTVFVAERQPLTEDPA